MDPAALPLSDFAVIATDDLDQARDAVARIFCPHDLQLGRGGESFDTRHHVAPLRELTLNYVQYGAEVVIDPGCLGSFYLLQIPLRGHAEIRWGGESFVADAGCASLASPSQPLSMRWGDDTPHLIVKLDQAAVLRHWEALTGEPAGRAPLEFAPAVALGEGAGAAARHLIAFMVQQLSSGFTPLTTPFLAQAEAGLVHTLLGQLPHSQSHRLRVKPPDVAPRAVRRAREYIVAHLAEAISVNDIAAASGLCVRSIQAAFLRHTGQSPMAFLRDRRLEAVHLQLRSAAPGATVTEVALRFGFCHLGRFASSYARKFGEAPSATLSGPH
ncbi:MAG TPA: AraC family transcriptional regulator [Ramlibacter sp.]|jgi:AraC-like DNA-binding protein